MATIALSRALVEFALIDRAPNVGYAATKVVAGGQERYLRLDDLIESAVALKPELDQSLRRVQEAGNRIPHPRKKQNVVQPPKVLRSEALDCVEAATIAIEILYTHADMTIPV